MVYRDPRLTVGHGDRSHPRKAGEIGETCGYYSGNEGFRQKSNGGIFENGLLGNGELQE